MLSNTLLYKNKQKPFRLTVIIKKDHIIYRTAFKAASCFTQTNLVSKINPQRVLTRNYAGKFRACEAADEYKKSYPNPQDPSKNDYNPLRNDANLTQHQATHINIEEVSSGEVKAIFTSAKTGPNGEPLVKVAITKVNDSFTLLIDPTTKLPVLDADGNKIPHPTKGGQYMAVLKTPRVIAEDMRPKMPYNNAYQPYLDKHENVTEKSINDIQAKQGVVLPKTVGGKDDEPK